MTATWSIVATVRETPEVIRQFVAHHLIYGADAITLYFDDPEDPAIGEVSKLDRVQAIPCDATHWNDARPSAHQARQKHNANLAYQNASTDWIIHIDADELLTATRAISTALTKTDPTTNVLRLTPAEAFANPRPSDTTTFRQPLFANRRGRRIGLEAYGEEYPLLNQGLLSHVAGKFFVRTKIDGMSLSIHGPWLNGARQVGVDSEDMLLLHLHGGDEDDWLSKVRRRMESGVYQSAFHDDRKRAETLNGRALNAHLQHLFDTEGNDGLRGFFRRVSTFDRAKRKLRRPGLLVKKRLWHAEKIATVFDQPCHVRNVATRSDTAELEGDIILGRLTMRIGLEHNYTEIRLGQGKPDEAAEMEAIRQILMGRTVDFYDIGANVGLYSLIAADAAHPDSTVNAFEPNPRMANKLTRNAALNPGLTITLHQCALGESDSDVQLSAPGNPGQATILPDAQGAGSFTVPLRQLKDFVTPSDPSRLRVFKIDIEGAEPLCLAPFFRDAVPDRWPNYILFEHAHTDVWPLPPDQTFPPDAYETEQVFATNTLLKRKSRAVS